MITAYYRPRTLQEAIRLLSKPDVFPMGGGTTLCQKGTQDYSVVDLQDLGLDYLRASENKIIIGATVKLNSLASAPGLPQGLRIAIDLEKTLNLRNMSTTVGSLMTGSGRSSYLNMMLALDAELVYYPDDEIIRVGDFLPFRNHNDHRKLITRITIPCNLITAFEYVARTPSDKPIICASLAQWPTGRTRLVIGGWGPSPCVATDGILSSSENLSFLQQAAQNAAYESDDEWASKEYRHEIAGILAMRCAQKIIRVSESLHRN